MWTSQVFGFCNLYSEVDAHSWLKVCTELFVGESKLNTWQRTKNSVNSDLNWKLSQHENGPEHETRLADPGLAKHEHLQADEAFQDLQQGDVCDRLAEALAHCSGKSGPVPCYRGDNRPTTSMISTIVSTCIGGRASYWRSRLHKHCGQWNRWPEASYILLMMMVLLFVVVCCCLLLVVVGRCLSLVILCCWWLFVVGRCLSLVVVCRCLSLFVVCRWLLFVIGRCLSLVFVIFHHHIWNAWVVRIPKV